MTTQGQFGEQTLLWIRAEDPLVLGILRITIGEGGQTQSQLSHQHLIRSPNPSGRINGDATPGQGYIDQGEPLEHGYDL
nr:hypothetical protein CFP56_36854 [Quercus suber]